MSEQSCQSCGKLKATLHCELCKAVTCKTCAVILDEGQFSFLAKIPKELSKTLYCAHCFREKVETPLAEYNEIIERAKAVNVFNNTQGKETRLFKRTEKAVQVVKCNDYEETLLRLAFFAAQGGYNSLVDVKLTPEKVRSGSYQTTVWSGIGIPTNGKK
ncbi:MAG: hypothetical protein ACK5P5_06925 [Pseudobdellovibrionaceae bacterium]